MNIKLTCSEIFGFLLCITYMRVSSYRVYRLYDTMRLTLSLVTLFEKKIEYFQKIIESLHFNKVLSNQIFLESTLAKEIYGDTSVAMATP